MTTERRIQIVYACIFGVMGVVGVRYSDLSDLWAGVLFLVLAALFFVGVSKKVEDFVTYALSLVVAVGFLLHVVESAVESVLVRSILAATALVMLLLAVGWLLTHAKRSARTS